MTEILYSIQFHSVRCRSLRRRTDGSDQAMFVIRTREAIVVIKYFIQNIPYNILHGIYNIIRTNHQEKKSLFSLTNCQKHMNTLLITTKSLNFINLFNKFYIKDKNKKSIQFRTSNFPISSFKITRSFLMAITATPQIF